MGRRSVAAAMAPTACESPILLSQHDRADDSTSSLLMDISIPLLPTRGPRARSSLDATPLSTHASPGKALDALDDQQLEELAWKSVGQDLNPSTSRSSARGPAIRARAATSASSPPSPDLVASSTPLSMISSPNIELRRRKTPRKSVVRSRPEDAMTDQAPPPVKARRDEKRERLGRASKSDGEQAQVEAHMIQADKVQKAQVVQRPQPPASPSKRSLPSMLPFSPYHKKRRPMIDVVEGPPTGPPSSASFFPVREERPSELLRLLGKESNGLEAAPSPPAKISWLKRDDPLRANKTSKARARHGAVSDNNGGALAAVAVDDGAGARPVPAGPQIRRRSARLDATAEGIPMARTEIQKATSEVAAHCEQSSVIPNEASQSNSATTSVTLATSPEGPLVGHSPPARERRKAKQGRLRDAQGGETSPATESSTVPHIESAMSTGSDESSSVMQARQDRHEPDVQLDAPISNSSGQLKGRGISVDVDVDVKVDAVLLPKPDDQSSMTPHADSTAPTLQESTKGLLHLLDVGQPRKPIRVSRRPARVTSSTTLQQATSEVPLGYRKTSTGNLVALPPSAEPSTYVPASEHFAKLFAQAEEEEKRLQCRSEVPKAHKVPEYLARRREEISRESAGMLQREVELLRERELRGLGIGAPRQKVALPEGLLRAGGSTKPIAKPRPTKAQPFVSSLETRRLERQAYETKRSAREALLEKEREKVREEKRRLEEEEIRRERRRRVPKANPVPDFVHGGTVRVVEADKGKST